VRTAEEQRERACDRDRGSQRFRDGGGCDAEIEQRTPYGQRLGVSRRQCSTWPDRYRTDGDVLPDEFPKLGRKEAIVEPVWKRRGDV
jgi:hypothetical protein